MEILTQIYWLLILSLVVASISWTVTQEEIFREIREAAEKVREGRSNILLRKFCYMLTCEYCFSHWVTVVVLLIAQFPLLIPDWRGYFLSFFTIPLIANFWMSFYRRLRVDIKHENALAEQAIEENKNNELPKARRAASG